MIVDRLNRADQALTNLEADDEALRSSVEAARSSINAARARALELLERDLRVRAHDLARLRSPSGSGFGTSDEAAEPEQPGRP